MKNFKIFDFVDLKKEVLFEVKKCFSEVCVYVIKVFSNEVLILVDCVFVMNVCLMVIILEKVENFLIVLLVCWLCFEEFYFMLEVKNNFFVEVMGGLWVNISKEEWR